MMRRGFNRSVGLGLLVGLFLAFTGCGGSKITKANADKITTGMTEKEVTAILGAPSESSEAELPNLGGLIGIDVPGTPRKAKQSVWKDGDKTIIVTLVDGKVQAREATGF